MPAWIPGSYLLRDFARHVVRVEAKSGREALAVEKTAAGNGACAAPAATLIFTITVYALDQSVRGAYLDRHARLLQRPVRVRAARRTRRRGRGGRRSSRRRIRSARSGASRRLSPRRASTSAASAPITPQTTTSCSIIRSRSATSSASSSRRRACRMISSSRAGSSRISSASRPTCSRSATAQIEFFGKPAPFDRYWFLALAVGDGYGGLEHRASTSLIFSRDELPKVGETGQPRDYQRFLGSRATSTFTPGT